MSRVKTSLLAITMAFVAGCVTPGPDYAEPILSPEFPQQLLVENTSPVSSTEPAVEWWLSLEDPILNDLVQDALASNRDLRAATFAIAAARARLGQSAAARHPEGALDAGYQRRQLSGASFGADDVSFPVTDLYDASLSASWEVDVVGRIRRSVEVAVAELGGVVALQRDLQSMVVAETVRSYADFLSTNQRLAVAERNHRLQLKTLDLTEARRDEGFGSSFDVARAASQAKSTEAILPELIALQRQAANRIATLTGLPLTAVEVRLNARRALPQVPKELAIGDVASLIARRPDIRVAERSLAAATARIGLVKTDYFPRITLSGNAGVAAAQSSALDDDAALGFGVGPTISWSGFNVKRIKARIAEADANARSAFAAYEQSLLVAVEETQSALAALTQERRRLHLLNDASGEAGKAADIARTRYDNGIDDFLSVLDAEARVLDIESAVVVSKTRLLTLYADTFRALGAGWIDFDEEPAVERTSYPSLFSTRGD